MSIKNKAKGWGCSSSGRAPAQQVQDPDFKLQSSPPKLPQYPKKDNQLKKNEQMI
jgi:hypothetical protein